MLYVKIIRKLRKYRRWGGPIWRRRVVRVNKRAHKLLSCETKRVIRATTRDRRNRRGALFRSASDVRKGINCWQLDVYLKYNFAHIVNETGMEQAL